MTSRGFSAFCDAMQREGARECRWSQKSQPTNKVAAVKRSTHQRLPRPELSMRCWPLRTVSSEMKAEPPSAVTPITA